MAVPAFSDDEPILPLTSDIIGKLVDPDKQKNVISSRQMKKIHRLANSIVDGEVRVVIVRGRVAAINHLRIDYCAQEN